jgi:hypothetical protein
MAPFQYLGFVAVILSKATLGLSTPMTVADPNAHTINHPMPLPDASPWRRQSTSGKLREKTRAQALRLGWSITFFTVVITKP